MQINANFIKGHQSARGLFAYQLGSLWMRIHIIQMARMGGWQN